MATTPELGGAAASEVMIILSELPVLTLTKFQFLNDFLFRNPVFIFHMVLVIQAMQNFI